MLDALPIHGNTLLANQRRSLDEDMVSDLLATLEAELTRWLQAMRLPNRNRDILRDDVQAVLSMAAGFGFEAQADRARTVLSACHHPTHHTDFPLHRCLEEMQRLRLMIGTLRPWPCTDGAARIAEPHDITNRLNLLQTALASAPSFLTMHHAKPMLGIPPTKCALNRITGPLGAGGTVKQLGLVLPRLSLMRRRPRPRLTERRAASAHDTATIILILQQP